MLPPIRKLAIFYLFLALPVVSGSWVSSGGQNPPAHYRIYQESQTNEADLNDSYEVFYDQLSSAGHWIYVEGYGYVFQPNIAANNADWRPYANGHWESTDRGWYWDTEEPFGWATYHYGRWTNIDGAGWVWAPGTEWAPAWVSWRMTDNGFIGWAPLPPECPRPTEAVAIGGWCDSYSDLGPGAFCFLPFNAWVNPSYVGSLAPSAQNLELINASHNVTNISVSKGLISNWGPRLDLIAQETKQPVKTYSLHYTEVRGRNSFGRSINGNVFNVNSPATKLKASATKVPTVIKTIVRPTVNKGWNGLTKDEMDGVHRKYASEAHIPNHLPSKPIERVNLVPNEPPGGLNVARDQRETKESKQTDKGSKESEKGTGGKNGKGKAVSVSEHKGAGKHKPASETKGESSSKEGGKEKGSSKGAAKSKKTKKSEEDDESPSPKKSSSSKSGGGKSGGSKNSSSKGEGSKNSKSSSGANKKASEEKGE